MGVSAPEGQGQRMALTAMVVAVIVVFSLMPMLRLLQEIVLPGGHFSLAAVGKGLGDPVVWRATMNSLVVGLGGTVLALVLGVLVAFIVGLTDIRMTQALVLCFVTPLMIAPQVTAPDHPLAVNLPETWPAILGYNRLTPRLEATVVATAGHDPLLAAWQYGHGRAVAFASDCGPHWAPPDFVAWDGYATLWQNIANWAAGNPPA